MKTADEHSRVSHGAAAGEDGPSPSASEGLELLREIAASLKRVELLMSPVFVVDDTRLDLDALMRAQRPGRVERVESGEREPDRTADFAWIKANAANYRGNWVALKGGELLAYSKVLKEVIDALADDPPKALIHRIPDKEGGPFATDSGLYEW